ncbi:MAG: efflux RND transporter periplasmic adaptor subunit [Acidobacteriota bacterium]
MSLARFLPLIMAPALAAQTAVEVVPVVARQAERRVRLPGEFAPYEKVDLYARVNGFVERVTVDRGSAVKRGQLLVLLSAPEMEAQRAEAEAKAQTIESQRAEAEAKLVAAESTRDRMKAASATPGAISENELIQAAKAADAARAVLRAQASAAEAAKASVQSIRELEAYLKVTAPFDGVITERLVHPGALAGPGASAQPMLRLEQNSRLRLVVAVPEASAGGIVRGARVPFTVPAYPGETFSGTVARIAHSVDPKTRTMAVEADVNNASGRLAPGMFPEVQWPVRRRRGLFVPPSSVVTTTERTFVIRVKDGRAEWVDVTRGSPEGDLIEVFGPLNPGDLVVRRATDEIREGSAVKAGSHS